MADLSPGQSAKQMLERQLEQLGSLYNAGVRSQSFREWRQATLTCIQRIWPAEPARPERFRRIPFSPPMGRPDERAVREYYERGCGEAASVLKDWVAEIATVGLSDSAAPTSAGSPSAPSRADDDFPTVELPGPSSGASAAGAVPPKPRLKDMLGFTDGAPAGAAGSGAPPLPQSPAPAAAGPGAPPLPQSMASAPAPAPAPPPSAAEQAMAELESHGFFARPGHALREPSAATPAGSPAPPSAPAPPAAPQPRVVVSGNEPPASAPPSGAAPVADAGAIDPNDLERVADELLRASSALSSLPRRPAPERTPGAREVRSPIPLAIAALALEIEALGVPEGHRSRVRAMLLDLSRRLDAPNLTWGALRDAMSFVMEYPTLGRRMVPLLLPYFDRAA